MNTLGLLNREKAKMIHTVTIIFGEMVKTVKNRTTGKVFSTVQHGNMMS